ncbi:hypothetical protein BX600DRAFT_386909 [Xylariales sp. PMI_506]|nr:hypothetical protein BX600DRAFT_386909 [Xylariales sp. PMI_506]
MPGDSRMSPAAQPASPEHGSHRPRRVRTSKPKVKTGCNNCKQRRIKCDEKRPACTQCVRSKKVCTGYPPPPRAKIFEEVRIAPRPTSGAVSISPTTSKIVPVQPPILAAQIRAKPANRRRMTPPQTPAPTTISLSLHRPNINLPFEPQEGLYFQLFRERTASELSGFFDSSFWTRSVLQECHSEESVRHSVVALGALYKTLEKMCESPPGSPSENFNPADHVMRHWEVAFRHYSLALKSIISHSSQDQGTQRTSLMATVLLACFDSFIGDHKQAIRQIQTGLRLLEKLRAERRRAFMPKPEEPVEQDLIQMFTRLAIQAKSYDMAFHFPQPFVIRLTPPQNSDPMSPSSDGGSPVSTNQSPIPPLFHSLLEARLAWDALCEKIFRFTETMFQYTSNTSPMGILPTSLQQYGMEFKNELEAWSTAFENILNSRNAPGKSSQEKAAISVLKMSQIMGQILFLMTFSESETQFDAFLPHFKAIVNLALEVVGDEEREAAAKRCPNPQHCQHGLGRTDIFGSFEYTAPHIKPSFSADLGIVPPLFVVATKCRDPITRRQAIQLLRSSSRREGMWDSELSSRIGMWVATIEEESAGFEEQLRPTTAPTVSTRTYSVGSPGSISNSSIDFGDDIPLGPGGNARWDSRRESVVTNLSNNSEKRTIPEEKRVMVRAVEFDLRERIATLKCGTRNLTPGMPDFKTRSTTIAW